MNIQLYGVFPRFHECHQLIQFVLVDLPCKEIATVICVSFCGDYVLKVANWWSSSMWEGLGKEIARYLAPNKVQKYLNDASVHWKKWESKRFVYRNRMLKILYKKWIGFKLSKCICY